MIVTFGLLTLVNYPVMKIYASYNNFKDGSFLDTYDTRYALGNMGFAESKCINVGLDVDKILLQCHQGYIGLIFDFGYIAKNEDKDICMRPKSEASNQSGIC